MNKIYTSAPNSKSFQINDLECFIYKKDKQINNVCAEIVFHSIDNQYKEQVGYWYNGNHNEFILNLDIDFEYDWYDLKELITYGTNALKEKEVNPDIEKLKKEVKEYTNTIDNSLLTIEDCLNNMADLIKQLEDI